MTSSGPGAPQKTASGFEVRMSTKHGNCPVCEGESTLIIRKVAVEDRKALLTNQWLKKRLRAGSRILCGEDYIDTVNFLARNRRICTNCLFVTSIEDEQELKYALTKGTVETLLAETEKRFTVMRTALEMTCGDNLDDILKFGDRLESRLRNYKVFSAEGRKHFQNPAVKKALIKLCLQHVASANNDEMVQSVVSMFLTYGTRSIRNVLFDLPLRAEVIRVIYELENSCLAQLIATNNEFSFVPQNPILGMEDVQRLHDLFKEKRGSNKVAHHLFFMLMNNLLSISEFAAEEKKKEVFEMALVLAVLSMDHEERTFATEEDKERERKRAENTRKALKMHMGQETEKDETKQSQDLLRCRVDIDPRRPSHNREILSYIILKLQKTLNKPIDKKLRDRAIRSLKQGEIYSFQGMCAGLGEKLEGLFKEFL